MPLIVTLFETIMIICFGLSWPMSLYKSWKSRTAKGKSILFELFAWVGYIFGITKSVILYYNGTNNWVFFLGWAFYILNFLEITVDILLYFRNVKLDSQAQTLQE